MPALAAINCYFLLTWLGLIAHVSRFTSQDQYGDPITALWTLATTASYAMIYLLPALAGGYLAWGLLRRAPGLRRGHLFLALPMVVLPGMVHVAPVSYTHLTLPTSDLV